MPNLTNVDIDDELDKEDCVRRVLAESQVPRTIAEITEILAGYARSGMVTLLPSKKKRRHADFCDVTAVVAMAEHAGWLHKLPAKKTFAEIAEHTDGLASTLSHTYPTDDGGQHNRVLDWAAEKQQRIDEGKRDPDLDVTADHYVLTHAGFEALTGHKQGERPEPRAEIVDPSDIQPAAIGDA